MTRKALAVAVLAASLAGCGGAGTTAHVPVSMKVGQRKVTADMDGTPSITSKGEMATIRLGGRTILVESTRVLVDGTPRAILPADAKDVRVTVRDGETTITVDGKPAAEP